MDIETTFKKRFQARRFLEDKIPDKELIKSLLEKTFELVPSKQSIVPYKTLIFGPEHKEIKEKLYDAASWHWQEEKEDYPHFGTIQLLAPYLIIFTDRQENDPNPAVLRKIERGHPYSVLTIDKSKMDKSLEVGMFATILTGLCLEEGLAVGFTLCLPRNKEKLEAAYLDIVIKDSILLLMSIGYPDGENFIKEKDEYKPPIENVIEWK